MSYFIPEIPGETVTMHCDCGFVWRSDHPRDSVEYHMMSHAGQRRLVDVSSVLSGWYIFTAPITQRYGFTRDN